MRHYSSASHIRVYLPISNIFFSTNTYVQRQAYVFKRDAFEIRYLKSNQKILVKNLSNTYQFVMSHS